MIYQIVTKETREVLVTGPIKYIEKTYQEILAGKHGIQEDIQIEDCSMFSNTLYDFTGEFISLSNSDETLAEGALCEMVDMYKNDQTILEALDHFVTTDLDAYVFEHDDQLLCFTHN